MAAADIETDLVTTMELESVAAPYRHFADKEARVAARLAQDFSRARAAYRSSAQPQARRRSAYCSRRSELAMEPGERTGEPEDIRLDSRALAHGLASLHADGALAPVLPARGGIEQAARAVTQLLVYEIAPGRGPEQQTK
jgi:hypothetical protein